MTCMWTMLPVVGLELPQARACHATCAFNELLIVAGGRSPRALDDCWSYNISMCL